MWLSLVFGGLSLADENRLLIVGFSTPPYLSIGPDDEPHGLLVDVVKTAAAESDVEVHFEVTSWPRAQLEVRKGRSGPYFSGGLHTGAGGLAQLSNQSNNSI
jgi:ABC-type amino acid transport substrate-binding protein